MKEIINVDNWNDFKSNINALTSKGKGDAFELLVKCYLKINPSYVSLLKNVWLYDEIPFAIHQRLNLPDRDMGIDLIAETKQGQFWAIQCKYRDNESKQITWREIATFEALAFSNKKISFALLCATSEKITQVVDKQENIGFRTIEVWRHLDKDFFDNARSLLSNRQVKLSPFKPYAHQKRAIKNAAKHFIKAGESRGKLIMPCGTGKSLTAFWIADKIKPEKTIVVVPSLSLLSQTLDVWLRENIARNKEINWMAVCSDETVAESEKDELSVLT
jgi:predicted helicase